VAAVFPDFVTYALPAIPAYKNGSARAPRPGDTIILFGTGFGPVTPDVPVGRVSVEATSLVASVQITFTGSGASVPGKITYAGLVPNTVGLYQFNVVLPTLSAPGGIFRMDVSVNGAFVSARFLSIPIAN
jgi:uncharacterized protein (TIGR03437 family)